MTSFDVASSSDTAMKAVLEAIAAEVKDHKTIIFDGKNFMYEKDSMVVDNNPYSRVGVGAEEEVSDIYLNLSSNL